MTKLAENGKQGLISTWNMNMAQTTLFFGVVKHASLFHRWQQGIHPNLRGNVFAEGTIYNKDEVNPCLRALGFSEAAAIREKTLGLLLDGIVRAQDTYMPEGGIPKGIQVPSMNTRGVRGFSKPEDLAAVEEFFSTRKHNTRETSHPCLRPPDPSSSMSTSSSPPITSRGSK
ncbi:hypothetical protein B0I72DRAFT_152406 [Yarrowia lipolytica]|nr:hypothetical protein B0I72DRAFT_152406 [Yarrowia lipolytica]